MHAKPHTFMECLGVVLILGGGREKMAMRFPSLNLSIPLMLMADKKWWKQHVVLFGLVLEGRGVGIGPGGRGVTFHSFSFCLPLIAKLLFLREMQGATLNQYFCGAFINYGLKSTNLSSSTCFNCLLPEPIASCLSLLLIRAWIKNCKNKQIHHSEPARETKNI